jgi:hypothetical protein
MTTRDSGLRHTRHLRIVSPPEQIIADTKLALMWRAQFRAEKASHPTPTATTDAAARTETRGTDRQRRIEFAKGIARLELGRAYWDEKLHRNATKNGLARAAPKTSALKTER